MDIQVSAEMFEKIFNLNLREAALSDKERKELNLKARRLIEGLGISIGDSENEFDVLRDEEHCFVGYADYYLQHCWDESELKNKPDLTIYSCSSFLKLMRNLEQLKLNSCWHVFFISLK